MRTDPVLSCDVELCNPGNLELSVSEASRLQPDPGRTGGGPDHKRNAWMGEKLPGILEDMKKKADSRRKAESYKISGKERLGR